MLEAAKAGVAQADQDGEQQDQEVKQGGGGRQTWGQRDAALEKEGERAAIDPHPAEEGPHLGR